MTSGAIEPSTVRALVADQFPSWSSLPITPVTGTGSDHHLFRVGDALVARFPRDAGAALQVTKEQRWLPVLAPALPVDVPVPVAHGRPGHGVEWPWSVLPWLPGRAAGVGTPLGAGVAAALADVVGALGRLDPADGPGPGPHNGERGAPLAGRDDEVREALAALRRAPWCTVDTAAAEAVWRDALAAPPHRGAPRWVHGDLLPGNVLLDDDAELAAVIDFGCLGVGDPACDLMAAWTVLPAGGRVEFGRLVAADDAAWRRGRGWALSFGLIALPYHRERTPGLAAVAERAIREVLAGGS